MTISDISWSGLLVDLSYLLYKYCCANMCFVERQMCATRGQFSQKITAENCEDKMEYLEMEQKLKVGIIGATGYVGQRFITLLADHPWFEIAALCASPRSAGKTYEEAVEGRWKLDIPCPESVKKMVVYGTDNIEEYVEKIDFTFCAVDMKKDEIRALEEKIAKLECPVVSNNSANRWTEDVPMVIPEINSDHIKLIEAQRARLGTKRGFIAVKPNCSIQSYVPALTPFLKNGIKAISVCTYQAISGAGKTFKDWPEMVGNVIPYIGGEEEKSEKEPLKVWGKFAGDHIELAQKPVISAQCYRVAVQEGHTAAVSVSFENKPSKEEMIEVWKNYESEAVKLGLPQLLSTSCSILRKITVLSLSSMLTSRTAWAYL